MGLIKFKVHYYSSCLFTSNFGKFEQKHCYYCISLSIWDYLFKINYITSTNEYVKLGYKGDQKMSKNFLGQMIYGFKKGD